jgi:hypothetical protein
MQVNTVTSQPLLMLLFHVIISCCYFMLLYDVIILFVASAGLMARRFLALFLQLLSSDRLRRSFLHSLVVGKFDALWSHADESTVSSKAVAKEGHVADKKKAAKKTK